MSANAARAASGAAAFAVLSFAAACASPARREADRLWLAGDAAGAAAAYDSLLAGAPPPAEEDLLLLRAATAAALADPAAERFARSRELLDRLVARHPASPHRPSAALLLALLDRLEAQAVLLADARAAAEELLARGADDAGDASMGEPDVEALRQALAEIQLQFERLRDESRARAAELERLRRQIEMLKAIDLERPEAEPAAPPR